MITPMPPTPIIDLDTTENLMTERSERLRETADAQIAELIEFLTTLDEATARHPCPSRETLGDGTIAAAALHTADNYQRITTFVATSVQMSTTHGRTGHSDQRVPRFLRVFGHRPPDHAAHGHDHSPAGPAGSDGSPGDSYRAESLDLAGLLEQLSLTQASLQQVGGLTDNELDAIPPSGSFRFADGKRTLEQVLSGLLKHQRHQVDALTATTG